MRSPTGTDSTRCESESAIYDDTDSYSCNDYSDRTTTTVTLARTRPLFRCWQTTSSQLAPVLAVAVAVAVAVAAAVAVPAVVAVRVAGPVAGPVAVAVRVAVPVAGPVDTSVIPISIAVLDTRLRVQQQHGTKIFASSPLVERKIRVHLQYASRLSARPHTPCSVSPRSTSPLAARGNP